MADRLLESIRQNKKSEWWHREDYVRRYSCEESDPALYNVFEVFDDDWLETTLDSWVRGIGQVPPIVHFLIPQDLYSLVILVELGKDLAELGSLKNFEHLVEELRTPSKFIATWLESELAAHCVRRGCSIELYPRIRGKEPDLRLLLDSEEVLMEIKEIHPGEMQRRYYEVFDFLSSSIIPVLPHGISIEVSANKLPTDPELQTLTKRVIKQLKQPMGLKILRLGRLRIFIKAEKRGRTSFSLIPPKEIALNQLKRLGRSIKHEAKQIRRPHLGVVVLDAGVLQGFPDEVIRNKVEKTFKKYRLRNIIAAVVVRSYKFYRLKEETEVIIVSNPCCREVELLEKLSEVFAFSRTRRLVPE